jgi:hypothetical protein
MASAKTEFSGLEFKNSLVIASIEPTNSPEMISKRVETGAGDMIISMPADVGSMAVLIENPKCSILNDKGGIESALFQFSRRIPWIAPANISMKSESFWEAGITRSSAQMYKGSTVWKKSPGVRSTLRIL